jgi:hypothetical protein
MLEFIKDVLRFLAERKKWWLIPIAILLALLGAIIIFGSGSSPLAPFIYSIF